MPLGNRTSPGTPFRFQVEVPADQLPGVYEYRVATKQAVSSVAQLLVTDYPVIVEADGENGTPATAQKVPVPAAICGVCEKPEDVDCYRFAGKAGQELTIEIFAQRVTDRIHGMVVRGANIYLMSPILTLYGPTGQVVAQNDNFHGGDSFLHVRLPLAGDYTLEVRDARYAGDPRYAYCVEIADRPYVQYLSASRAAGARGRRRGDRGPLGRAGCRRPRGARFQRALVLLSGQAAGRLATPPARACAAGWRFRRARRTPSNFSSARTRNSFSAKKPARPPRERINHSR